MTAALSLIRIESEKSALKKKSHLTAEEKDERKTNPK